MIASVTNQYPKSLFFLHISAYTYIPSGYLGCYKDHYVRVLQGKRDDSNKNSGDYCKSFCKGFRYAGTEVTKFTFIVNCLNIVVHLLNPISPIFISG